MITKEKTLAFLCLLFACLCFAGCNQAEQKLHQHDYALTVTAPTCTEQGYTEYLCACGNVYFSDYVDALGHKYNLTVTNPTCLDQGYTIYICECGHCYNSDFVQSLGHSFSNYISNNDATYESDRTKTAICDRINCNETDTKTDTGSVLIESEIRFNTLQKINGVYKLTVANATNEFSFSEEITVSGNAYFAVDNDLDLETPYENTTVELSVGDNVFYLLTNVDGKSEVLTVIIRRKPLYEVSFAVDGDRYGQIQTVEEGDFVIVPQTAPTKIGYDFDGWNFDFSTPITEDTVINSKWSIINYNITYQINEFAKNPNTVTAFTVNSENIALLEASANGYDFMCWQLEGVPITEIPKGTACDITLVAVFNPIFTVDDGEITGFTEYGKKTYNNIFIPSSIDGVTIKGIGKFAFYGEFLISLSFDAESQLEYIGSRAFASCTALETVELPNALKKLGDYAFYGCTNLSTVTFESDSKLESLGDSVFYNCKALKNMQLPHIAEIGNYVFNSCSALESLKFGGTVEEWTALGYDDWSFVNNLSEVVCINGSVKIS